MSTTADPLAHYAGTTTVEAFREIADLEMLGRLAEPHRLRLGVAQRSRPPPPLFGRDTLPERVTNLHGAGAMIPGASFLAIPGCELGSFGLLRRQGRVLLDNEAQPHGFNDKFTAERMPPHWVRGLLRPDIDIIDSDEPVAVVLNCHLIYGHFLLEMLARIHLVAELATMGRPLRVAVPTDAPAWVRDFIALYIPPGQILAYDSMTQRIRAPCFVLPTMMMLHYLLHPQLNVVVQHLLGRVAPTPPATGRLYLSRQRHPGWHALTNEPEIESVMTDLGFTTIHPQELPLPAQLALYAGAACIVSPYSSAAHNALFAPPGTPVFCFGWMNRCQSGIAALRSQPLAFMAAADGRVVFPPPDRPPGVYRQTIDCTVLAREVPAFLRFAERSASGGQGP